MTVGPSSCWPREYTEGNVKGDETAKLSKMKDNEVSMTYTGMARG